MSHWNCLLSRRGPLGTIWVASHCPKRVKKGQVSQINVSSSVDKILLDEVPVVTYRVLGYFLLGVVRIYSKQVEYLFHDCHQVLVKVNDFVGGRKVNIHIEAICTPYISITRPESFELDAFDLQILDVDDARGSNIISRKDIMLADKWQNEGPGSYLFDKYQCEGDAVHLKTFSTAYTPIEDVLSPYAAADDSASLRHSLTNAEARSIEKLRGNDFSLEECLEPIPLCDIEEESAHVRPFGEMSQTDGGQSNVHDNKNVFGAGEESPNPIGLFKEEDHMSAENVNFLDMISPEKGKFQNASKDSSINIDVTPQSKCRNSSDTTTTEFVVVQTPAARELPRLPRKRKCLCDDIIVLPNKVLKESICNSSNLVCKRKRTPHTALNFRKEYHISSHLPRIFLEPLFSGISLELRSLFSRKALKSTNAVETPEDPESLDLLASPSIHQSPDEEDIAPATPVAYASSLRLHELRNIRNSDKVITTSSFESIEKEYEDKEFDISLESEEINSLEGDNQEINKWSVRTRMLARQLWRGFLHRKTQKEDEVVNFSQIVKHKTRSKSARLFYEILVLKTRGYIDVKQHAPYADILVLETPMLKLSCEADEAS